MQTLGFAKMDPNEIKEASLSSIVALSKELDFWIAPINLNEGDRAMGQRARILGVPTGSHFAKKKLK